MSYFVTQLKSSFEPSVLYQFGFALCILRICDSVRPSASTPLPHPSVFQSVYGISVASPVRQAGCQLVRPSLSVRRSARPSVCLSVYLFAFLDYSLCIRNL